MKSFSLSPSVYIYIYWSYDPHRSRDSVSPVCGIFPFIILLLNVKMWIRVEEGGSDNMDKVFFVSFMDV